jgi:DNA-binding response OmpR family regulator
MKVLLVEDEKMLANSICEFLQKEKYICETASTFIAASEKIFLHQYDCIILDINLPDGLGFDLIHEIKEKKQDTGILILSARNSLDDKLKGLDLGSDDYLAKPFHLSELNARLKAIIRRKNFNTVNELEIHDFRLDLNSKTIWLKNQELILSNKEYDLLLYFIRNSNRVLSKNSIAEHLWGDDMDMVEDYDLLYAQIKNLRKKINLLSKEEYIHTVYGMGYQFKKK